MNPDLEEALFALALEKPPEQRAAFLDAVCGGDPARRRSLDELLAAHDQPHALLPACDSPRAAQSDSPALPPAPTQPGRPPEAADEAVGKTVGRYKLLEKIGEGGCGVVYVAEQTEPMRRRVALKVVKLGMDTKAVVALFEAERQALAMMDHPNIAKVLDAGAVGGPAWANDGSDPGISHQQAGISPGRPYFVMELVRTNSITKQGRPLSVAPPSNTRAMFGCSIKARGGRSALMLWMNVRHSRSPFLE